MHPDLPTVPQQRQKKVTMTILFWMFMLLLAVVFYKMNQPQAKSNQDNYTEFQRMLEEREIRKATMEMGRETARVYGTLNNADEFEVTVPREATPEIIAKFREQGVPVTIQESTRDVRGIITTLAPLVLIALLWIFMIRQMRKPTTPGT